MSTNMEKAVFAVLAALVVIALWGAFTSHRDCKASGGVPVRGVFGVECIKECRK